MKRLAHAVLSMAVAPMLAVWLATAARAEERPETASQPMIGVAAPGFELRSIAGDTLSLSGLRGKLVVVHFGASW